MPFNPTRRQLSESAGELSVRERQLEQREKRRHVGERLLPVARLTSDAKGRLRITSWPVQASEDWWSSVLREIEP